MSDRDSGSRSVVSSKAMDVTVAAILFAFGALVVYDSSRLGARWAEDGPQSGYFPFYIGLLVCISSIVNLVLALRVNAAASESCVSAEQLKAVLSVAVPSLFYVALIQFLGIYVASTVFIVFFMLWLGKYGWLKSSAVSVGVSVAFFVLFEVWFKVPLPKGPLEAALGLN